MIRHSIFNSSPLDVADSSYSSFSIASKRFYYGFLAVTVLSLTTCNSWTLPTTATTNHANIHSVGGSGDDCDPLRNTVIWKHTSAGIPDGRRRRSISTQHHSCNNDGADPIPPAPDNDDNRRKFLATILLTTLTVTTPTAPATALQKKNEALCGTGFFEHYDEFRCTPIGDISDEGTSKELSAKETDISDGLMGKLGVVMDDDDGGGKGQKKEKKNDVVASGEKERRKES